MNKQTLTPEQAAALNAYERGIRLQDTLNSAGWSDVLDIMEGEVAAAEFHLMNYNGTDAQALLALQRRARGMREFFQKVQLKIHSAVNEVESAKQSLENPNLAELEFAREGW